MKTSVEMEIYDSSDASDNDEEMIEFIASDFFNRRFSERTDHFATMRDNDFVRRFRLTKSTVLSLLAKIEDRLEFTSDRNQSISPMNQLLCALRFYATGSQLITCGDVIGVHESTACRIIHRVTDAIARMYPQYIKFPSSVQEQNEVINGFYNVARFPRTIGAVDCTHVEIYSPGGDNAEMYRCRKGYFSINVQAICTADLKFTDIVARWHGSAHDANIWDNCAQKRNFLQGKYCDYLLLGDSGYAQTSYMMVPLAAVTTRAESLYNESHKRTRNVVERAFGVLKRRFPILARGIQVKLRRVPGIIVATAVLHNIALQHGEGVPPEDPEFPLPPELPDRPETIESQTYRARLQNTGQRERRVLIEQYFARL